MTNVLTSHVTRYFLPLVPCYIEADDSTDNGRLVLVTRHLMERNRQRFFRGDVMDEVRDIFVVKRLEYAFSNTPFSPDGTRWKLHEARMKVEEVKDSEARFAGWMGAIAIRTEVLNDLRAVKGVKVSICNIEGRVITKIAEERRKGLDECIDANAFLASIEYEEKTRKRKRWLEGLTALDQSDSDPLSSSSRFPYIRKTCEDGQKNMQAKTDDDARHKKET